MDFISLCVCHITYFCAYAYVCVCVCARVRACVHACVILNFVDAHKSRHIQIHVYVTRFNIMTVSLSY